MKNNSYLYSMNKDRIIEILHDQLAHQKQVNQHLSDMLSAQSMQLSDQSTQLSAQIDITKQLSNQISLLQQSIISLEEALLKKDESVDKLTNKNRGLSKLLENKSEKQDVHKQSTTTCNAVVPEEIPPIEKLPRKGNNNAKRKEFYNLEVEYKDKFSDDPNFDYDNSKHVSIIESIAYKCTPMSFTKVITRLHTRSFKGDIYAAKADVMPLMNSNYDASFIAGILQLRYIYSMPVERIVKFFAENNFEVNKPTAHALLKKSALLLERLDAVMRGAVLEDHYIGMDESYHKVLVEKTSKNPRGSVNGYIWCALAMTKKLLHFFYDNGSRGQDMFLNYLPSDYQGAISSDGLAVYKRVETDEYPNAIRLSCLQHCKRYFLDIENDPDARVIIDLINKLYQRDHEIKSEWSDDRKLKYRQKYAPALLKKIKSKLESINNRPIKKNLPKSQLATAVKHMLKEFDALSNYILRPEYRLDNNAVERAMRYISLSRKNSLFAGSHQGAKRSALFYSLACSCRLNKINTFEYFTDILNKMAAFPQNVTENELRELLPDRWCK